MIDTWKRAEHGVVARCPKVSLFLEKLYTVMNERIREEIRTAMKQNYQHKNDNIQ